MRRPGAKPKSTVKDAFVAKPFDISALADALETFKTRGLGVFERPGLAMKV